MVLDGPAPLVARGDSVSLSLPFLSLSLMSVVSASGSPKALLSLSLASFLARTLSLMGTPPSLRDLPRPVGPEPIFGLSAAGRLSSARS